MNVLSQQVLKLNRLWQVIGETTVEDAIKMMCIDVGTALLIEGEMMRPVFWDEWIGLPVVDVDGFIRTRHKNIRRPTVMVCLNYAKVPIQRPKFTLKNIALRDGGRCQYTGRVLSRDRWSMDHVLPLSRGGKDAPENVVLADKEINNRKGNKTPIEAGLPQPSIRKLHAFTPEATHPHHALFLK